MQASLLGGSLQRNQTGMESCGFWRKVREDKLYSTAGGHLVHARRKQLDDSEISSRPLHLLPRAPIVK